MDLILFPEFRGFGEESHRAAVGCAERASQGDGPFSEKDFNGYCK